MEADTHMPKRPKFSPALERMDGSALSVPNLHINAVESVASVNKVDTHKFFVEYSDYVLFFFLSWFLGGHLRCMYVIVYAHTSWSF